MGIVGGLPVPATTFPDGGELGVPGLPALESLFPVPVPVPGSFAVLAVVAVAVGTTFDSGGGACDDAALTCSTVTVGPRRATPMPTPISKSSATAPPTAKMVRLRAPMCGGPSDTVAADCVGTKLGSGAPGGPEMRPGFVGSCPNGPLAFADCDAWDA